MSNVVIHVDNVGKCYELGLTHATSIREVIDSVKDRIFFKQQILAQSREFWALKDVSFQVKQGDVIGIIGRNGAGKSTLLKLLSRITSPTSGKIVLNGRVASLLEVGTGFHPELTGRENIFLNGTILGMSRHEIKKHFDQIVAFSGIEKFIDTPVKRYSSGMSVRLGFAVAAHLQPEILIVDEVLAVGDIEFQSKCIGKMQEVSKTGRTILFVSHDLSAVRKLCSNGILLHKGLVHSVGNINHVLNDYMSLSKVNTTNIIEIPRPEWATPLIYSASIMDHGNQVSVTDIVQGSDICLQMGVKLQQSMSLQKPVMGVVIYNSKREIVGGVNTRMTGTDVESIPAAGHFNFNCTIYQPPLLQGKYFLELWLGDGEKNIDVAENALEFNIVPIDLYGSGKPPYANLGTIYFNASWSLS